MEIRTKHLGAGFEAGGYGNWSNTMTKKGGLFWSSKRNKKQARKNGSPQFKIPVAAVAGEISFNLK